MFNVYTFELNIVVLCCILNMDITDPLHVAFYKQIMKRKLKTFSYELKIAWLKSELFTQSHFEKRDFLEYLGIFTRCVRGARVESLMMKAQTDWKRMTDSLRR